ncbi:unnamed protein product, partial [Porites lobata]
CVPPESISPPEPPNNYGDVYDEVDDLYAELSYFIAYPQVRWRGIFFR